MHITFAIYYKFYPKKTHGPLILKVPHTFMTLLFFFVIGLKLKGFFTSCEAFDSRWTWTSVGKMGLNLKLVGTNHEGNIVTHKMHKINLTKYAQIVPKCLSFTYHSFTYRSSLIDCSLLLIVPHTHSQIIPCFHSHIVFCSHSHITPCSHSQTTHKDCSIISQSFMFVHVHSRS